MSNDIILYQSVISDIRDIITAGRDSAYSAASAAMVMTYWNIGKNCRAGAVRRRTCGIRQTFDFRSIRRIDERIWQRLFRAESALLS